MAPMLSRLSWPLRRRVWHTIRGIIDVFHPLPPCAALLIFGLLWQVGQVRELYISYLEHPDTRHIVFALLGFGMVSVALYACHFSLGVIRENIIYANYITPDTGLAFRRLRRVAGALWAFLPWLGLVLGLIAAKSYLDDTVPSSEHSDSYRAAQHAIMPATGLILGVGAAVAFSLDRFRRHGRLYLLLLVLIGVLLVFAATAAFVQVNGVALYRWFGPFATLAIEILFVFSLFAVIALLSRRSGFPAFMLMATALAIAAVTEVSLSTLFLVFAALCGIFVILAFLARLWAVTMLAALLGSLALISWHRDVSTVGKADPNAEQQFEVKANNPTITVQQGFRDWLKWRKDKLNLNDQQATAYPVFIIAVEGGGIYASTAAALLLARLEENIPNFAEHVFAISAVSGGAIGASVFQALVNTTTELTAPETGCNATKTPLHEAIAGIMKSDHFSPVVGAIFGDFLGGPMRRAESLEASFLASVSDCPAERRLNQAYLNHWKPHSLSPALILNTTSAETGYRVAFAPFRLHDCNHRTLYSFADQNLTTAAASMSDASTCNQPEGNPAVEGSPANTSSPAEHSAEQDVTLIFAAVASARFPFIVQPYSVKVSGDNRWNFVDGGYADNSGAETAFDIYRALVSELSRQAGDAKQRVASIVPRNIKLILLTSDDPEKNFAKINGTRFADSMAPIRAMLSVRTGLADQAVERVCDYFRQRMGEKDDCQAFNSADSTLKLIRIPDEEYGLPLGWKISDTTFDLVSSLIGDAKECGEQKPTDPKLRDRWLNSCVLRDIRDAIGTFDKP